MFKRIVLTLSVLLACSIVFAQFGGGSGTEADPWLVVTAEHFDNIRNYLGENHADKFFLQTADIVLDVPPWNEDDGWVPLGNEASRFHGSFDGNGQIISGLTINRPGSSNIGLFGYISGAFISNVTLEDVQITGNDRTGGLTGRSVANSVVISCTVLGSVTGSSQTGGLIGQADFTSIEGCLVIAGVSGSGNSVGGMIGINNDSFLYQCQTDVMVTNSANFTGGLVGFNNRSTIDESFALGSIEGSNNTGGLVGGNMNNSDITNCYSVCSVTGADNTGGLIGSLTGSSVLNSYWDSETSGQTGSAGGEGRSTSEMTYPYAVNTYVNWDFDDIWGADTDHAINDGYPYLLIFLTELTLYPPENLTAEGGDGYVLLLWEEPLAGNPLSYNVYRDETLLNSTIETEYEDTDVVNGVTYLYYVTAVYDEGESEPSNTVEVTPEELILYPPQNLNFTVEELDVLLYWDAPAIQGTNHTAAAENSRRRPTRQELLGYNVYRNNEMINPTTVVDTFYIDEDLELGVLYVYYVTAVYQEGESLPSNEVEVMILSVANEKSVEVWTEFSRNYPNPFNTETTIHFKMKEKGYATLRVYNIAGQKVIKLSEGNLHAGYHSVVWKGTDRENREVASGLYFYLLETDCYSFIGKMLLLK